MSFTPGPWEATLGERGHYRIEQPSGGSIVATTVGFPGKSTEQANARLIAAAPDLYAALKEILAHVENLEGVARTGNQCTLCHTYRMIGHEAIRKADGK